MNHATVWRAIERLAKMKGLTCSGLAICSGLDSTTFNKSKHFSADGTPRWPSCSTIAKVINATHISLLDFVRLMEPVKEN